MAMYSSQLHSDTFDRLDLTKEMEGNGRTYLDLDQSSSVSSKRDRPNVFIAVTFTLELLILAAVIILEYYIRWTDIFPMRKQNFSCVDPSISYSSNSDYLSEFAFRAHVPVEAIYALSICVPPFVISIGEIGVWAFTSDPQKVVRALCKQCRIPQVFRRLVRFIGVFLFGSFTLLIFVDVTKFMTGVLRPNFLEICQLNVTACALQNLSGDEEMCSTNDYWQLRDARLSFPSMHSALTTYSAVFTAIYLHGAIRTHSVKILRPFLSLSLVMMALLCGLSRIAQNKSHWTDVAVGFAFGLFMAIYLGVIVLNCFMEGLCLQTALRHFHRSLYDVSSREPDKSQNPLFLPGHFLHIPRAHLRSRPPSLASDGKHRMRSQDGQMRELNRSGEHYRNSNSYASHM